MKIDEGQQHLFICDDYGLDESTNLAIRFLAKKKLITGASVLVTHCNFVDRELSQIQVGLHLNLTQGKPISPPEEVSSLTNSKGEFLGLKGFILRTLLGLISEGEIRKEIIAQIEKFKNLGVPLAHIDGHEHIHYLPSIHTVLTQIKDLFLPQDSFRMRNGMIFWHRRFLASLFVRICLFFQKKNNTEKRIPVVDYGNLSKLNLNPSHQYEFMMHVAHPQNFHPNLNQTSLPFQNRVEQFKKRLSTQNDLS